MVSSSILIVSPSRYTQPLIVVVALAALAALVARAVRSWQSQPIACPNALSLYREGNDCSKRKEHLLAISKFTDAKKHPTDHNLRALILCGRAVAYERIGQPDKTTRDINKALQCNFEDIDLRASLYYKLGIIYEDQKELEQARENFTKALEFKFSNETLRVAILSHRGLVYLQQKEFNLFIEDMTAALRYKMSEEGQTKLLFARGGVHIHLGNYEAGIQDFTKALEIQPNKALEAQLLTFRAMAYDKQKDHAKAMADSKAALLATCFSLETSIMKVRTQLSAVQ